MRYLILSFLSLLFLNLNGQSPIRFVNPSFEGEPRIGVRMGEGIKGWRDCTEYENETAFDVQPQVDNMDMIQTNMKASHGKTFISVVTRKNGTYESLCQRLQEELKEFETYQLSIQLATADGFQARCRYKRKSLKSRPVICDYDGPTILRVWGGNSYCEKDELLYQSEVIDHTYWKKYLIEFTPEHDYKYLSLEVYYANEDDEHTNGNLLIDAIGISQLRLLDSIRYTKLAAYEIIEMIEKGTSELNESFPKTNILRNVISFKQSSFNLIYFINEKSKSELTSTIETVNAIGANDISELLQKLLHLKHEKEILTEEEEAFFTNCNVAFEGCLKEKSLDNYLTSYVRENKNAIVGEMVEW